jgi:RNA polymerase sigma factor (sigma-70 family)
MTEWTEAERFLLGQIRRGDAEAWGQLVERYQGRLLAFARSRGIGQADAEDLVQDTFLRFLRGLSEFREQASIETYLFVILRRQVIEHFRGKQTHLCRLTESLDASEQSDATAPPAPDPTASWYVRRDEDQDRAKTALKFALKELAERLQRQLDFQSLQLLELLFYAQARNKNIAALLGVDEQHVGLQKHRWLKQLRKDASAALGGDAGAEFPDPLLTQVWEEQRPTCPKRTTIGSYLLGSLDDPWRQYVDFHLNRLGCTFCQANLQDLQKQQQQDPTVLRQRIMQSTIGFLRA